MVKVIQVPDMVMSRERRGHHQVGSLAEAREFLGL